VFDLRLNEGWVSAGIDHDAAQFAVQAMTSSGEKNERVFGDF